MPKKSKKPKEIMCEVCGKPLGPRGIRTESGYMHYNCQPREG